MAITSPYLLFQKSVRILENGKTSVESFPGIPVWLIQRGVRGNFKASKRKVVITKNNFKGLFKK